MYYSTIAPLPHPGPVYLWGRAGDQLQLAQRHLLQLAQVLREEARGQGGERESIMMSWSMEIDTYENNTLLTLKPLLIRDVNKGPEYNIAEENLDYCDL